MGRDYKPDADPYTCSVCGRRFPVVSLARMCAAKDEAER